MPRISRYVNPGCNCVNCSMVNKSDALVQEALDKFAAFRGEVSNITFANPKEEAESNLAALMMNIVDRLEESGVSYLTQIEMILGFRDYRASAEQRNAVLDTARSAQQREKGGLN